VASPRTEALRELAAALDAVHEAVARVSRLVDEVAAGSSLAGTVDALDRAVTVVDGAVDAAASVTPQESSVAIVPPPVEPVDELAARQRNISEAMARARQGEAVPDGPYVILDGKVTPLGGIAGPAVPPAVAHVPAQPGAPQRPQTRADARAVREHALANPRLYPTLNPWDRK
jgi:hypothetical protein